MNEKKKVVVSFVLGLVLGGAVVYTGLHFCYTHWKDHAIKGFYGGFDSQRMLDKLTHKLDLNLEQKVQIEKILESKFPKMKEIKESVRPELDALRKSLQTEIRSVLDSDQQKQFDEIIVKYEERKLKWKEKRG